MNDQIGIDDHGTSDKYGVDEWMDALVNLDKKQPIRTVVDFGCGAGDIGQLLRDRLPSIRRMVGVDGWAQTVEWLKCNKSPYDEVINGDMRTVAFSPALAVEGGWDLWVFGDCLEHIPFADVNRLVNSNVPRLIAARIPVGVWPQGNVDGNEMERHVWSFYPSKHLPKIGRKRLYVNVACDSEIAEWMRWKEMIGDERDYPPYHCLLDTDATPTAAYIANIIWVGR
jgi:hypothetical protein